MPKAAKVTPESPRLFHRSFYFWLLLGGLATILALVAYDYLPERRLQLMDADTQGYVYADERNAVELMDEQAIKWRCKVTESHIQAFCGIHLVVGSDDFEGLDLSQFHSIHLNLDYQGGSPWLRYYFRNRELGFSERSDLQTHKFMQAHIATLFLPEGLVISLDEFYVAEWWLAQYRVPRELSRPNFEHVTAFGIDLSNPLVEGEHVAQLHSAELVGNWITKEQWYGGIIALWLVAWVVIGIGGLWQLRSSVVKERQRSHLYRELSQHDQLTGLLNRHGITAAIERHFAHADTVVSLLVLDIDHFKPFNDQHGHDLGDYILAQLGQVLQNSVRHSDCAARWGGEEFVILLPQTPIQDAHGLAEKLRCQIAQLSFSQLPDKQITVSIGLAERQPQETYNELFKRADMALYMAKARGRNQTVMAEQPENASSP